MKTKGGHPLSTSKKRKQDHFLALLTAKKEIPSEYKLEMGKSLVKWMKRGCLAEIISEVERKNNVSEDVLILKSTI